MSEVIKSTANSKIKRIRSLGDKKARSEAKCFILEGYNSIKDVPSYARVCEIYVKLSAQDKFADVCNRFSCPVFVTEDFVFDSITQTENASGILAVIEYPQENPLSGNIVIVCDGISDAGNMGTIIRTAAAMGIKDIVAVDSVDFYNPKTVRASMSGIFHVNLVTVAADELKELLDGYTVAALDMNGSDIYGYLPNNKVALAVGSEAHGISKTTKELSEVILSVPMPSGNMESLNAAVSVGIALSVLTHNSKNN